MKNTHKTILLAALVILAVLPMAIQPAKAAVNRTWMVWGTLDDATSWDEGSHQFYAPRGHYYAMASGGTGSVYSLTHFAGRFYTGGIYGWRLKIYCADGYNDHFTLHVFSASSKTIGAQTTVLYQDYSYDRTGLVTIYPSNMPVNGQYLGSKFFGQLSMFIDHIVVEVYVTEYLPW